MAGKTVCGEGVMIPNLIKEEPVNVVAAGKQLLKQQGRVLLFVMCRLM